MEQILLKGVRVHNLQSVDLTLDHGQLICFTGVSGSGKTSLAFDTLFVEGQRRYLASLPQHMQWLLGQYPKPELDSASGISPTMAIEQKSAGSNPRSTVGTITEIYDYLRVLFARCATAYCPISGEPVQARSRDAILAELQQLPHHTPLTLLAPICRHQKGSLTEAFDAIAKQGYTRVRIDGTIAHPGQITLAPHQPHDLDVVVDRLEIDHDQRLRASLDAALILGHDSCIALLPDGERLYSTKAYSPASGRSYQPLEPIDFAFNSSVGMCEACHGMGCAVCDGSRIKPYPAAARLSGLRIYEVTDLTIEEALGWVEALQLPSFAEPLVKAILNRLHCLLDLGLGYLQLSRMAPTLSGGEAQRVRLASHIGSGLVGVTYILDEPSIGLHPRDTQRLLSALRQLRDRGNTVIVIEHDAATIAAADHVVDVGPGAGVHGGRIVYTGTVVGLLQCLTSVTGAYMSGREALVVPSAHRTPSGWLTIEGATLHNLKAITARIPLGCFVAITGVSGSGKSSLFVDTLLPALTGTSKGNYSALHGNEQIDKAIAIDQSPIGRTPRSNPATYIGVYNDICALYSSLPLSKARGYSSSQFRFNAGDGACSVCNGKGMLAIAIEALEPSYVVCPLCNGQRFDQATLEVRYQGASIKDALTMTIAEALAHFHAIPAIQRKLAMLERVGLDYVQLGQPAPTLSGGEAQRLKLARELAKPSTQHTLYLLDEPTTGLHPHDIQKLLAVLQSLVDRGNSVLLIEHNMDLVRCADYLIDMGPDSGNRGGEIIATGTPEQVMATSTPTGRALATAHTALPLQCPPPPSTNALTIHGACQHNLKNLTLEIPLESLTTVTGPSGAGKSSLVFDTLYAEGQRRFVESLPPYVRQQLPQPPKPHVEAIDNLPPTIAIEQRALTTNPRSTVGTITECYDQLRLLYARLGVPYCPVTGHRIRKITQEHIVATILAYPPGEEVQVLAPISPLELPHLQRQGFRRVRLNGTMYELTAPVPYDSKQQNSLFAVVDRLKVAPTATGRIAEAVATAAKMGRNQLTIVRGGIDHLMNLAFAVEETGVSYPPITAKTFSFTSPEGMCPVCKGLGCATCGHTRLNPLARHVLLEGVPIGQLCRMSLEEALAFFERLVVPAADRALNECFTTLLGRLRFLIKLGLGYLSLEREGSTLSAGESQRVHLARQVASGLTGVLYLLDEPTLGLHPADTEQLISCLKQLQQLGNTVVIVDHNPFLLAASDQVIELGPGAGPGGGQLVSQGPPQPRQLIPLPTHIAQHATSFLEVRTASAHNIHDLDLDIPLQQLVCLTGVSGSGKSTLLHDIIHPLLPSALLLDQQLVSSATNSDVATAIDALTPLREFYAALPASRALGLRPSYFSPFHKKGMCPECRGRGVIITSLQYLPPAIQQCTACKGLRLNPVSLSIQYQLHSIGELLQLPMSEVRALFATHASLARLLDRFIAMGLGYLPPGQELSTLSHGELQRIRLAQLLARQTAATYLLDEPTAGLDHAEVQRLIALLRARVAQGCTVIVIEHNLHVIAAADWIIDIGPGAGDHGGKVLFQGPFEALLQHPTSLTGRYYR